MLIKKFRYNDLYDDMKQEVALYLWENKSYDNLKEAVKCAVKSFFANERKYKKILVFRRPKNQDGEDLDESYYLVDPSTLPQYGVRKSPVTELMRMKVTEICKSKVLIAQILNRKFNNKFKGF